MNLDKYEFQVKVDGVDTTFTYQYLADLILPIRQFSDKGIHIKRVKVN